MKYQIKTTMEVIKEVYAITKNLGLGFILTGSDSKPEIDDKKIINQLFETNLTNHFCQLVTGDHETNFDQLLFLEQEEIILSFFTDIMRLSKESQIIQTVIRNMIKVETPSLISASSADKTESTQTA
jgi:hypothetical protein